MLGRLRAPIRRSIRVTVLLRDFCILRKTRQESCVIASVSSQNQRARSISLHSTTQPGSICRKTFGTAGAAWLRRDNGEW